MLFGFIRNTYSWLENEYIILSLITDKCYFSNERLSLPSRMQFLLEMVLRSCVLESQHYQKLF